MQLATTVALGLLLVETTTAFSPVEPLKIDHKSSSFSFCLSMAVVVPPPVKGVNAVATNTPAVQKSEYCRPTDIRYSDFLNLVNSDKIQKVTFSADGTQLLGMDVDGTQVKIEALPNDPALLTQLTDHKVRSCACESSHTLKKPT